MKSNRHLRLLSGPVLYSLKKASLVLLLLSAAGPLTAQTIPNPGFEEDTFTVFPGYVSGNAEITGWTGAPATNYGLNPGGGSPFADNGTVPQGTNVAFIQSQEAEEPTFLSTEITGLTPGTVYRLSFRTNARGVQAPRLSVTVGDTEPLLNAIVNSVGGTAPYKFVYVDFTAAAATETLILRNEAAGDTTVLVDDFTIAPAPETDPAWSFEEWQDDTTSGVDPSFAYTHAYSFGSAAGAVINGVPFKGVAGGLPTEAGKFTVTGSDAVLAGDTNNITAADGGSAVLAANFIYNGNPGVLTLQGLTPNTPYILTLYSAGWDAAGERPVTFSGAGDTRLFVDQDLFDNDNGIRIIHSYTSTAEGTASVSFQGLGGTFHLYGFSNRSTTPQGNAAPVFVIQPIGGRMLAGEVITLSAGATGLPAVTYQWFRNGTAVAGATAASLEITAVGAEEAGLYTLTATNNQGTATSSGAFVEVVEPKAGPLFSTGVDEAGTEAVTETGLDDLHYTLIQNPDGEPNLPALVHTGVPGVWVPNTATSQWIGPSTDGNAGVAVGDYVYRTTVDLTGQNKDTAVISGFWASDNEGLEIRVNGVAAAGVPRSTVFTAFTWFSISAGNAPSLVAGVNTVDFVVNNAGAAANPGGLRVQSAGVPAGIAPVILDQPQGGTIISGQPVTLTARAYGSDPLSYQWTLNGADISGAIHSSYTIGSFAAAQAGTYAVRVTSPLGTDTSANAVLDISDVPPSITTQPAGVLAGAGETFTLSVTAAGSAPFSYEWSKDGTVIPSATGSTLTFSPLTLADTGSYTVKITNAFGTITSNAAVVEVKTSVPAIISTGLDAAGVALEDGAEDPHYTLLINPGGENDIKPVVHGSTIFPIVAGPWVANTATSKWISPLEDSVAAGGQNDDGGEGAGVFVYRTTIDLTGFNPASVIIAGTWATDNLGRNIRVNGVDTGLTNTVQFTGLTPFEISAETPGVTFVNGLNTLDFLVENQDADAGYTALRVEGRVLGVPGATVALPAVGIRLSAAGRPVISFTGIAGSAYRIERSTALSGWTDVGGALVAPAGGLVEFEDAAAPAGRAFYRVIVPLPEG